MNKFCRIHKNKIIRCIDHLTECESKYLKKKISFMNKSSYHNEDWIIIDTLEIEVGDILINYSFTATDNYYVFDFDKIVLLKDKDKYVRFDTLKNDQIRFVLTSYKNHLIGNDTMKMDRGTLISLDGILYYVYNIEKNICSSYRVSLEGEKNSSKIKINGNTYYSDFLKEKSFKTDNKLAISIAQATSSEIEDNKKTKKFPLKESKNRKRRQNNLIGNTIIPARLTSLKDNKNKKYVVIYRIGNEACVIDYDDYLNNIKNITMIGVTHL